MLDGRVLGASQVEYKPFGKPPLQREVLCSVFALSRGAVCSCRCSRCAAYAYGGLALRHLPRLPGIEASSLPSLRHTEVGIPTSLSHRGRNSDFAFLPKKPITGPAPKVREICCPRSITPGVFFSITGPAPEVRQRGCPRRTADRVFFFTIHTPCRQSWRGRRIATQSWRGHRIAPLNPGVGTGLPHSILAWAQDCPTQSWRGHRIATLNPGVGAGLPRCFPENSGSAVLYSTTPPDSPPGLPGKLRERTAV